MSVRRKKSELPVLELIMLVLEIIALFLG